MRLLLIVLLSIAFISPNLYAQLNGSVILSGIVKDENGQPIPNASVYILHSKSGTITHNDGSFSFKTSLQIPFTLVIESVGYSKNEIEVKSVGSPINIQLQTQNLIASQVVVTASRKSERALQSPITIEKLDIKALKETPAPSFYDAIGNLKGVQMTTAGLTFKIFNTRGFNVPSNYRFMQLVDGVDNQSATLGVPLGNAIGPTELDIQSIEVTPGVSSALYGMNALNGMSQLLTKDPFTSQGLSVYQKVAANHLDGSVGKAKPITETSLRYAKAFNDKFAFKVNGSYMEGTDWYADYHNDFTPNKNPNFAILNGKNNIAGDYWNNYADNSDLKVTDANKKQYTVHRTGYWEKDLIGDYKVKNVKVDATLAYRIKPNLTLSYTYRWGKMDGFFQRGNRIGLKNVIVQNHKIELVHPDFVIRAYTSLENTGDSYNMNPLATNLENSFKSDKTWLADYTKALNSYIAANGGSAFDYSSNSSALLAAHQAARAAADNGRFEPGTERFVQRRDSIKKVNNWDITSSSPIGGARLLQQSHFYQGEGTWNLHRYIHWADVLIGADHRSYEILPDGNTFVDFTKPLADRATPGGKHIWYRKTGGFVQASKQLDIPLKLTASLRFDKNDYFSGKFNPRISGVYTLNNKHFFRGSFQNGFRFPGLFEGFSFVNNGGVRRVGGFAFIEDGLGYFKNSYLKSSVDKYSTAVTTSVNSGLTQSAAELANASILQVANLSPIKPEKVNSFEIGYKSIFTKKLYIDIDAYYTKFKNFIGQVEAYVPVTGNVNDPTQEVLHNMTDKSLQNRYRVWTNSNSSVSNYGIDLAATYNIYKGYTVSGNISYNKLVKDKTKDDALVPGFNTPDFFTNLSFGNSQVTNHLGFNVVWHWQNSYQWQNLFGDGPVHAINTVDAQVSYHLPAYKSTIKIGGSNILNHAYYQYVGGPEIRGIYYAAITIDGLLSK